MKPLLTCLFSLLLFSQQEASHWYFGENAGLKFNEDGTVTALSDGQIFTNEGCATISDAEGNLLFYTDGLSIWDRNHIIIPNANHAAGTGLKGHPSSTHSGIIVPHPGNPNQFYVFTVDEPDHINAIAYPNQGNQPANSTDDGFNNGLNYSLVDLTVVGSNGSIGDVITSNVHLVTYNPDPNGEEIKFKCSEKITAVKNFSNNTYWVITHFIDKFYAFQVSATGVNQTPVVSQVGSFITIAGYRRNAIGQIKVSPDGSRIAVAHTERGNTLGNASQNSGILEIFDFDIINGNLSNHIIVDHNKRFYGVEFSPNSKLLYSSITSINSILQFNLDSSNIAASMVTLVQFGPEYGAIQLASDNKLYVARLFQPYLSVINQPNNIGLAANFQAIGLNLAPGTRSRLGLPPFVTSFFNPGIVIQNTCLGDATQFELQTGQVIVSATWDFGDGNSSNALNPTHTYANAGTYTVSVTASTAQETVTRTRELVISPVPTAHSTQAITLCLPANQTSVNLNSLFASEIYNGQDSNVFQLQFFTNQANLNNNNPISNPSNFSVNLGQTYNLMARLQSLANNQCADTTTVGFTVLQQPQLNNLDSWVICQETFTGSHEFNLESLNQLVFDPSNAEDYVWQYFLSEAEAINNQNPLPLLYTNTQATETIFVRVHHLSESSCFAIRSFNVQVIAQPQTIAVSLWLICSTNTQGIETVNLSDKTAEILNGQLSGAYQVTFHLTETNAINNQNALSSNFTNTNFETLIYYRITAIADSGCFTVGSFVLQVTPAITLQTVDEQFFCDDNDDLVMDFVLTDYHAMVLGNLNPQAYQISFHLSMAEATNNSNALPNNYQNSNAQETWHVRVESLANANCFSIATIAIRVFEQAVAHQPTTIEVCDDVSNNGIALFDLNAQTPQILQTQDPAIYQVSYYLTPQDVLLSQNALPFNYTNTSNPQTIIAKVTNVLAPACFNLTNFEIKVHPLPFQAASESVILCQNSQLILSVPAGFLAYEWNTGATTRQITVTQPGTYTVTVNQQSGAVVCQDTKTFVVSLSNPATITQIITNDWSETNNQIKVAVNGLGNYVFSLDGVNYQSEPVFNNLPYGFYTVYVDDLNDCGEVSQSVYLHYYPKYFTPNGDGVNDFWQIKGAVFAKEAKIYILDRYGKLITSFSGNSPGWNGMMNNQALPSTDYWFVVEMPNGIVHKGHFSLVR